MNSIYKNFDNDTLEYDRDCYPWDIWVLEIIQELYPYVTNLQNIHKHVPTRELVHITDDIICMWQAPAERGKLPRAASCSGWQPELHPAAGYA